MQPLTGASPTSISLPSDHAADERLSGEVLPINALHPDDCSQMLGLLERHFSNVCPTAFAADLAEKSVAILIREPAAGRIVGFSTLMRIDTIWAGEPVCAFFSGDTIVDRAHWGSSLLSRLWARHIFALAASAGVARPRWFLICSGYKTYRFLPLFFRRFYPAYSAPTPPDEQALLDHLAHRKFSAEYHPAAGIVRLRRATPLRPEVAPLTPARRRDPHVAFFETANPGHAAGDELACLTELTIENLTPAGRRTLGLERSA